jgi:choline-glycine betaine transporter
MPSRIRNIIEPLLGWMFILVVALCLAAVLYIATRPKVEFTGRDHTVQQQSN